MADECIFPVSGGKYEALRERIEALQSALREIKFRVSGLETVGPADAIRRLRQIANLLDGEAACKLLEPKSL